MRIAMIPLDSRPANRQFPARLADIAGIELYLPGREKLGSLHQGADGLELARWLVETANSNACNAVVISWDALIYGGLIQSRQMGIVTRVKAILDVLRDLDRMHTACYSFITVPRLGISVTSSDKVFTHQTVREYLIAQDEGEYDKHSAARAHELAELLGSENVEMLHEWRARNLKLIRDAMLASAQLSFKHLHIAVEDNAPKGPHIREVADLRQSNMLQRRDYPDLRCTFFDGADECGSLLLARAYADQQGGGPLPVQLTVHPDAPGPERYIGRFETHSLEDGLGFLGKFLGLHFHYASRKRHWLVTHGVQPQPDLFEDSAQKVFNNPFLLPKHLPPGTGNLFVSDLAACNGGNPFLPARLADLHTSGLHGLVGFNTNFNTLGLTAALIRMSPPSPGPASMRFLLERLADDFVYQPLARAQVIDYLDKQELDPMDFSNAHPLKVRECEMLCSRYWEGWLSGAGKSVLSGMGVSADLAAQVRFRFPWSRAFEVATSLDF